MRANGTAYAVPLFVKKTRKYGKIIDQTAVTRKKPILVTGAHDSGKSRWLTRLYEEAEPIWGAKIKAEPLWLGALSPLAAWCDSDCVKQWWDGCRKEEEAALKAQQGGAAPVTSYGNSKPCGKSNAKPAAKSKSKTRSKTPVGHSTEPRPPWSKLKQWERSEVLPDYCRETNAVLFIDDAHKLTGRKLEIARLCVLSSNCLLYTSPSPRDRTRSRMPSSA